MTFFCCSTTWPHVSRSYWAIGAKLATIFVFSDLMHQSFVTMGNSGGTEFSFCKARVYAQYCMDIFMLKALPKALLESWQVNVKLPWPVWAWSQKPSGSTALHGQCRGQNLTHKPRYVLAISSPEGADLTNDWCITAAIHYTSLY